MINLKTYKCYRKFLADYFEEQKKHDSASSLRTFAKALGMSASALHMVMSGLRDLTVHKMFEVATALKFGPDEIGYFEALVHYTQAQSSREKNYYQQKLKVEGKTKAANIMRVTRKELLSEWYLPAFLLYLVDRAYDPALGEFVIDYKLMEERFQLSRPQVDQLFASLMKMGALELRRDQKAHVVIEKVGGFLTNQAFVLKVIAETERRLKKHGRQSGSFYDAHTLTMARDQVPKFISEYKKLINQFILEDDPDNPDVAIYQTLAALFPVT